MVAPKTGPQDMPPPGGYGSIPFARVPLRTIFTAPRVAALYIFTQVYGWYCIKNENNRMRKEDIEDRSARFAMAPFLQAERDRRYLMQLRKNRDYERELMKDVPDWEVGTWYGVPIYETVTMDEEWTDPSWNEYTAHAPVKDALTWLKELRRYD